MKKATKKQLTIVGIIILVLLLVMAGFLALRGKHKNLNETKAKEATETFVNGFLMPSGSKAKVTEIDKEYGLYKLTLDIGSGTPVESYMTKDGKLFFPQAFDVDELNAEKNGDSTGTAPVQADLPKSDKPSVELFVMSYCPYGTQIEKGILPAIEALKDKIDFKLKFVDYAMHGEKELQENMVQYCIQKDYSSKLNDYLSCFLKDGKSDDCIASAGINANKIASCVKSTDQEFKVTENFNSKTDWKGNYPGFAVDASDNTKYNVAGSPTLVINGQEASSNRDASSLLATICSAFNQSPEECQSQLSTATPSAGFGDGTTDSANAASCE
jgi:preprotein translocase subunit YajC